MMTVGALRPWYTAAGITVLLVAMIFVAFGRQQAHPVNRLAHGNSSCGPEELPRQQSGLHLIGNQPPPVPYSSTPPTSGWHASGGFAIAVSPPDRPLSEPQQVSVLEAGGVVITYHQLPERDRGRLEAHVRNRFPGRVAVTSYDKLKPGQVALTAWGVLQRCDTLDLTVVDNFVAAHAAARPAAPGAH